MAGSAVGLLALKTDRKISPETVFEPSEPLRVTLISRPDTPRRERSRDARPPTAVRGSAAKIIVSRALGQAAVRELARRGPASEAAAGGSRGAEPPVGDGGAEA